MNRPNILFALADDASHFGIYGHDFVDTSHIDWVAKNGVIFENAFTANPKCAPSRASILTGRYPWENKEACNHYGLFPSGMTLLPDVLEENGYHVGYTGKGWGPGGYKKNGLKRNPAGNEYNCFTLTPPAGTGVRSCDYYKNFCGFLDHKEENQPFYFWYGCYEPHRPYLFGEGVRAGKSLSTVTSLPSYWPETLLVKMDILDYAYEIGWFDHHLGKMIDELRVRGMLENTLVVVTSDNGCPFPRVKGQMYEQDFHLPMVACWLNQFKGGRKVSDIINFTDIMPTFLETAKVEVPNTVSGKSFYDIFCTNASGQIDPKRNVTYFGREKHDLGREGDLGYPVRCIRTKEYLYIYNFSPERWPAGNPETGYTNCDSSPTKSEVIRLHKCGESRYYDLAFGKRPQEELYNIIEDVECINNLAYTDKYNTIKSILHQQLFDCLHKTHDPRLYDSDYFERFEYVGEDGHSWKALIEGRFKPL